MGKLIKFTLVLLILCAIGIAAALWNLNPILQKLKPTIAEQISNAIKQPVVLGEIKASLFPNTAVEIYDVSLKGLGSDDAPVRVDVLRLKTRLMPLIFNKELSVTKLLLKGVRLDLTRDANGIISAGELQLYPPKNTASKGNDADSSLHRAALEDKSAPTDKAKGEKAVEFELKDAEIEDFVFNWKDNSVKPAADVSIADITLKVNNLSKTETADFSLTASALSKNKSNISISGRSKMPSGGPNLPESDIKIRAGDLDLERLVKLGASYGAKVEQLKLQDTASIDLHLSVDKSGINIKSTLEAKDAAVKYAEFFAKSAGEALNLKVNAKPGLLGAVQADSVELNLGDTLIELPLSFAPGAPVSLALRSKNIALADLSKFIPVIQPYSLRGKVVPDLQITLAAKGQKQHPNIAGTINLENLSAVLPKKENEQSGREIKDINAALKLKDNTLSAAPFSLKLAGQEFSGTLNAQIFEDSLATRSINGDFKLFQGTMSLNSKIRSQKTVAAGIKARALDLESISKFAMANSTIGITGTLSDLDTRLGLKTDALMQTLRGPVSFKAENGQITGINILGEVLGKLEQIPSLGFRSASYIPEKYQPMLREKNTAFSEILFKGSMQSGTMALDNFELNNDLYTLAGQGQIKFSGELNLNSQLKINPEAAEELVLKEPKIKLLADSQGRIVIPVVIQKSGKVPVVIPDFSQLTERAVRNTAKEAGRRALDKVSPGLGQAVEALDGLFK